MFCCEDCGDPLARALKNGVILLVAFHAVTPGRNVMNLHPKRESKHPKHRGTSDAACSLDELDFQARRIGFDANAFLEKGVVTSSSLAWRFMGSYK